MLKFENLTTEQMIEEEQTLQEKAKDKVDTLVASISTKTDT